MQADLLRELTPHAPVTTNLRAFTQHLDLFDVAETLDFVGVNSNATIKSKSAENACEIDLLRSLKKTGVKMPGGSENFWVIEQKRGPCQLAGGQFAGAAGSGSAFYLSTGFARGGRRALFFLAATAHWFGEILWRGADARWPRRESGLQGDQPDRPGNAAAGAHHQGDKSGGGSVHSHQPRKRMGAGISAPAEQTFSTSAITSNFFTARCMTGISRSILRGRPRIYPNTKWCSPPRCICSPPGKRMP